jgi:hypothetical protein
MSLENAEQRHPKADGGLGNAVLHEMPVQKDQSMDSLRKE